MSRLLDIVGVNHENLVKEALIGMGARLLGRAGKIIVKNPIKSLGAGYGVSDVISGAKRIGESVSRGQDLAAIHASRITM